MRFSKNQRKTSFEKLRQKHIIYFTYFQEIKPRNKVNIFKGGVTHSTLDLHGEKDEQTNGRIECNFI